MKTKPIVILLDDMHLENRPLEMQKNFLNQINDTIKKIKDDNNIPIIVAAGDINEGIEGVKFLSEIESDVIYVTGNHEYWNNDFYEVDLNIQNYIQQNKLTNIHFLNNKTLVLHGIRFVGTTLWTSLGNFLPWRSQKNQMIKFYNAMGDFKKISAKFWYNNPNNITRLKSLMNNFGIEESKYKDLIENKFFNPLIELEEYNKNVKYLIEKLSEEYDGKTVVVSHHMPTFESWMKKFNINEKYVSGQWVNNEQYILELAKGQGKPSNDILMMAFYANDLKDLMLNDSAPDFWFHGHLHNAIFDIVGKTKIISSPMGNYKNGHNAELKYKILPINDSLEYCKALATKNIEEYDWNGNILYNLKNLEKLIGKFELGVTMGIFTTIDFQTLLENVKVVYEKNVHALNQDIKNWLIPIYLEKTNKKDLNVDFYNLKAKLDLLENKYKIPEDFICQLNEHSFIPEENFRKTFKDIQHTHYRDWLRDLQKLQIHIIQVKKNLLDYVKNLS
jgi:UDP-2,3-diacylglucosamine pyrophosphatase LpxH